MSNKKLNAIKEIEFRINAAKVSCKEVLVDGVFDTYSRIEYIDNLLFDINDFINDLKDSNETNWEIKNVIEIGFKW